MFHLSAALSLTSVVTSVVSFVGVAAAMRAVEAPHASEVTERARSPVSN